MIRRIGKQLFHTHDRLRFGKDAVLAPLVYVLPHWLTPNQVTMFRTGILIAWFPLALFKPAVWHIAIFLCIYFFDLLDGAMARLTYRITKFWEYLDHVSDKFNNIAIMLVLYGVTGHQHDWLLIFVASDVVMSLWLAIEGYTLRRSITYFRIPFEFVVKTALWVYLFWVVLPDLFLQV